jgi:threonine/homoserine/homoserine lactone efflux protein
MNTSNPKFWAVIGFIFGIVLAAGGTIATPLDALVGGLIQAALWFGVSTLIIKRRNKKSSES